MDIVFFTHKFLPDIGGVELTLARLSAAVSALGHRVTVVTESASEQVTLEGVTIVRLRVPTVRPFTRLLYWRWMWHHRALFQAADVLHFHDYGTFMHWFFPLRLLLRKPLYAMTFHGFDSWPVRRKDDLLRMLAARCMDVTFGCGAFIAKHYRQRVDHWYVGAPIRRPTVEAGAVVPSFLYVGRLADDTCILQFARCLAEAASGEPVRPQLTLVGDGPLKAAISAEAGTHCDLVFHGATADVSSFIEAAGYVVATGFLAVLDAFAFERPVIAPALTPIKRDYFASIPAVNDLLVLASDEAELVKVLRAVLEEPESQAMRSRVQRAKSFVDALTWERIAAFHIRAYGRQAA